MLKGKTPFTILLFVLGCLAFTACSHGEKRHVEDMSTDDILTGDKSIEDMSIYDDSINENLPYADDKTTDVDESDYADAVTNVLIQYGTSWLNVGAQKDLDGDGQDELIINYSTGGSINYQIWTISNEQLLLVNEDKLFFLAGDAYGGISITDYQGTKYINVWSVNREIGEPITSSEHYKYYKMVNNSLELVDDYVFKYKRNSYGIDTQYIDSASLTKNDLTIGLEEFSLVADAFEHFSEHIVDTPDPSGANHGMLFDDLLELL